MNTTTFNFVIVAIVLVFAFKFMKFYVDREKFNTSEHIFAFVGGVGSGKTISAIYTALKIYKGFKKKNRGLFIANFPVKVKQKDSKYACMCDEDIFKLKVKIPDNSVIIIDEAGAYFSRFGYKKLELESLYLRLSRQFNNCYIIFTDQRIGNIPICFRDKINVVYYLTEFRSYFFHLFGSSKVRKINYNVDLFTTINPEPTYSFFKIKSNYKTRMYKKAYNELLPNLEPKYYTDLNISAETLEKMIKDCKSNMNKKSIRKEISGSKNENKEEVA